MITKSYIKQDGCHNCQLSFEAFDYDTPPTYFCLYSAVHPRPPCFSHGEDLESYEHIENFTINRSFNYYKNKRVESWGLCERWKEEK